MTTYEIVWTPDALKDLEDIYELLVKVSSDAAERLIGTLLSRPLQLKSYPFSGTKEPSLKRVPGEFRYLIESHYKD